MQVPICGATGALDEGEVDSCDPGARSFDRIRLGSGRGALENKLKKGAPIRSPDLRPVAEGRRQSTPSSGGRCTLGQSMTDQRNVRPSMASRYVWRPE